MFTSTRRIAVATSIVLAIATVLAWRWLALDVPRSPVVASQVSPPTVIAHDRDTERAIASDAGAADSPSQRPAEPPAAPQYVTDLDGTKIYLTTLNPQTSIRGRVHDQDGKPIERAIVHTLRDFQNTATDATDSAGRFTIGPLSSGSYDLIAMYEEYSDSVKTTVTTGTADVDLVLSPLTTIEGQVFSIASGKPVTDFRIRPEIHRVLPGAVEDKFKRVRDDQGRFTLTRVNAGASSIAVGAKGFADKVVTIAALRGGEARRGVIVWLEAGAELRGRVIDSSGRPVKFAQIYGGTPRRMAVSDAAGTFSLDSLPAGPIEVTVKHEDYSPKTANTSLGSGAVNYIQIVLSRGALLEGVFTVGGQPSPGDVVVTFHGVKPPAGASDASVSAKPELRLTAHADEDGHYRIPNAPDGHLDIYGSIEPRGCSATWSKSIDITVAKGVAPTVDFDFAAADASIQGTVYTVPGVRFRGTGTVVASYNDFTGAGPAQVLIHSTVNQLGVYQICVPAGDINLRILLLDNRSGEDPRQVNLSFNMTSGSFLSKDIILSEEKH